MQLRKATRTKTKLRIGLAGVSGSGKTYSALLMASGLTKWKKIAVIDTENGSADLYDHLGDFNVLRLESPYSPERYIEAITTCEQAGMEVIILDSMSHEWDGKGGILDMHNSMAGNSFTNWGKLTPRHNRFIEKMLSSSAHVIATMRSKQDYVLQEKNGKQVPEKVGLKAVTRDGVDYEFTLVFDLDIKHMAESSKDRTGLFMDKPQFHISKETGELLKSWSEKGLDSIPVPMVDGKQIKKIKTLISAKDVDEEKLKDFFSIKSTKDLTREQADQAIKMLMSKEDVEPKRKYEEVIH